MKAAKEIGKKKWWGRAAKIATNPLMIMSLIAKCERLLSSDGLKDSKENIILLIGFIKDICTGKYKGYDLNSFILAIATILYIVTPIDVIPDFIAFFGWTDDIAILTYALGKLFTELEKYKLWKQSQAMS